MSWFIESQSIMHYVTGLLHELLPNASITWYHLLELTNCQKNINSDLVLISKKIFASIFVSNKMNNSVNLTLKDALLVSLRSELFTFYILTKFKQWNLLL